MAKEFELKIEAEGTIKDWNVKAKKDRLTFSGLELTLGELAEFARLIKVKKEGEVRCTIEPTAKRLGIKPIVSPVQIDGCDIRRSGIMPSIKGFHVPADRAETIVRYIREGTLLSVVFQVIQPGLTFTVETAAGKPEEFTEDRLAQESGTEAGDMHVLIPEKEPIVIDFKCSGMKKSWLKGRVLPCDDTPGQWAVFFDIQLGNYTGGSIDLAGLPAAISRIDALLTLKAGVAQWLGELDITGTADHRHSVETRRDTMLDQVNAYLDSIIAATKPVSVNVERGRDDEEWDDGPADGEEIKT